MEQLMNLLLGSFTGQLTLAILAFMAAMVVYFLVLFTRKEPHEPEAN